MFIAESDSLGVEVSEFVWVMNQARVRAVDRLQSEGLKKRDPNRDVTGCTADDARAIDTALFSDVTRLETAARGRLAHQGGAA